MITLADTLLEEKIKASQALVTQLLRQYRRPCVLWSGGKDSMVLLHMLRMVATRPFDVVCWREPWMPWKQEFANQIIEKWNLTVWDWHPFLVGLAKGNGRIDVLNHYAFGTSGQMILARGIEPPDFKEPWLCGRETFLSRPLGAFIPPWDVAFHGHKSADSDPLSGAIPLEVDVMDTPGTVPTAFPLRHWSDEHIWAYTEANDVPYDRERYQRHDDGTWEVLPYQWRNPDYYPACMRCLDPDEGDWVHCPKIKMTINNISSQVRWEKPALPYCNLRSEK